MRATAKSLLPEQRIPELLVFGEHPEDAEFMVKLKSQAVFAMKAYDEFNVGLAVGVTAFLSLGKRNRFVNETVPSCVGCNLSSAIRNKQVCFSLSRVAGTRVTGCVWSDISSRASLGR
jgi:hypothetical protein